MCVRLFEESLPEIYISSCMYVRDRDTRICHGQLREHIVPSSCSFQTTRLSLHCVGLFPCDCGPTDSFCSQTKYIRWKLANSEAAVNFVMRMAHCQCAWEWFSVRGIYMYATIPLNFNHDGSASTTKRPAPYRLARGANDLK